MSPKVSAKAELWIVRAGIIPAYSFGFHFISWHGVVLLEQGCEVALEMEGLATGRAVTPKRSH